MTRIALPTCVLLCAVAGCGVTETETVCTLEARAGVNVVVTDSATGAPIASGFTMVVQDGAYRDSTTVPPGAPIGANSAGSAWEREGVYSVSVSADGYKMWNKAGVRVEGGKCHVKAVSLAARLQRA